MSAERHQRAFAAFTDVLEAGLKPTLTSDAQPGSDWRNVEYDLVVEGASPHGLIHENIVALLEIAVRHGGRLWVGKPDGSVAILFPYEHARGPGEETPTEATRRVSRDRKKVAA